MAQIILETESQDFIDDMLEMSNDYFDFEELQITNDNDKIKHWIASIIKQKVDDKRKREAMNSIQYSSVKDETL